MLSANQNSNDISLFALLHEVKKVSVFSISALPRSVTLFSQTDGTSLEIKTCDAHDGQGLTLAQTAGLRTGCITVRETNALLRRANENEDGIYLHETADENASL